MFSRSGKIVVLLFVRQHEIQYKVKRVIETETNQVKKVIVTGVRAEQLKFKD